VIFKELRESKELKKLKTNALIVKIR